MHEYSIALEISKVVEKQAENKKVSEIFLSVGKLSGIFDESLIFYLEQIFKEKKQPHIKITTEQIDAEFNCNCGKNYNTDNMLTACPFCGKFTRTIVKGNECIIKSIITE